MRKRDVVGRRIVAVHQHAVYDHMRHVPRMCVTSIDLDNGSRIILHAVDTYDDYIVAAEVMR